MDDTKHFDTLDQVLSAIIFRLFSFIKKKNVIKALAATRKSTFSILSSFISQHYNFRVYSEKYVEFTLYQPRSLSLAISTQVPSYVQHLTLESEIMSIPPTVTYLTSYSDYLPPLPISIVHLELGSMPKNVIDFTLVPALTHVSFPGKFNQDLALPLSVTHLTLGDEFDKPLPNLPNLKVLHLGRNFNQPLDPLPQSLTHLVLGAKYNQPLDFLPPSLISLEIRNTKDYHSFGIGFGRTTVVYAQFNHPLTLPPSLTHLVLDGVYSHPLTLPPLLTHLEFGLSSADKVGPIPPKVESLRMKRSISTCTLDAFPPALTFLELTNSFNANVDSLPSSLHTLIFGENFNQPVDFLPSSLSCLHFNGVFNQKVDHLPPHLTVLTFAKNIKFYHQKQIPFDQPIDTLPPTLIRLVLGNKFNQPIDHLPPSLQILNIVNTGEFNRPVENLPKNLTRIQFGKHFNQPINKLPSGITSMELGPEFDQPDVVFPTSLRKLGVWLGKRQHPLPQLSNVVLVTINGTHKSVSRYSRKME